MKQDLVFRIHCMCDCDGQMCVFVTCEMFSFCIRSVLYKNSVCYKRYEKDKEHHSRTYILPSVISGKQNVEFRLLFY